MEYRVYKLHFKTAVHFGSGRLSSTESILKADTLFSALCIEAVKLGRLQELYSLFDTGNILISDTMPFLNGVLQLPKPLLTKEFKEEASSILKKRLKKLKYIPVGDFNGFLEGGIVRIMSKSGEKEQKLGKTESITKASINGNEQTTPYHVGAFRFFENCGLYFFVATTDGKHLEFLDELLRYLSFSGIGGKRSSGLGRFDFTSELMPPEMEDRIKNYSNYKVYMTLSGAMAREGELQGCLQNATYLLEKRSGFIYSDEERESVRKNDYHLFAAGSCFRNLFEGEIRDVNNGEGHPVYRYAKPFFMGVSYE